MSVSYDGRTYAEGKKITWKDGFRAIYCILHYNRSILPPLHSILGIFGCRRAAAIVNLLIFLLLYSLGIAVQIAAPQHSLSLPLLTIGYQLFLCSVTKQSGEYFEIFIYCLVVFGWSGVSICLITKLFLERKHTAIAKRVIATTTTF